MKPPTRCRWEPSGSAGTCTSQPTRPGEVRTGLGTSGRGRLVAGAMILSLGLLTAACSSSDPGSSSSSSSTSTSVTPVAVSGLVTAGPTCPVEQAGKPCPPAPVHGTVVALDAGGAQTASAQTGADGHYALTLPPGSYTLVVRVTRSLFPRCPSTPVTVRPGPPMQATIGCDTGIR
jgi:hypothetical protein